MLSALVTSIVYPAVVHWVWYTEGSGGWLYDCGFIDFAGAGVVHLVGGTAALITAVMIGPRTGRYPAVPRWLRFLDRCHLLTRKDLGERVSEIAPPEEDEMDVSKHSDVTDLGSSVDGPFDYIDCSCCETRTWTAPFGRWTIRPSTPSPLAPEVFFPPSCRSVASRLEGQLQGLFQARRTHLPASCHYQHQIAPAPWEQSINQRPKAEEERSHRCEHVHQE